MHLSFFKIKIKRIWIITKFIFIIVTMVSNNVFSESLQFTSVSGGNNLTLSAVTSGQEENQSLLFIHGFSQSYLSWEKQLDSDLSENFLLAAFDLRGHGTSEKPFAPKNYKSSRLWADDVNAVIQELGLKRPILIGWSWAGFIIMDYVRHYGVSDISGINFVGANTSLEGPVPPPPPKPGQNTSWFKDMMSPNIITNKNGVAAFIDLVTADPLGPELREKAIIYNMMTPYYVRNAMMGYPKDNSDLIKKLTIPILITHGTDDLIVNYSGAASLINILPNARLSTYQRIGHAPFLENPDRFNGELARFAKKLSN